MKLALAGDTMLGRNVGERLAVASPTSLFADDVVAIAHEADLFLLNLECAISDRGERWHPEMVTDHRPASSPFILGW